MLCNTPMALTTDLAFLLRTCFTVSNAATIRWLLVIFPSFCGTLKSTLEFYTKISFPIDFQSFNNLTLHFECQIIVVVVYWTISHRNCIIQMQLNFSKDFRFFWEAKLTESKHVFQLHQLFPHSICSEPFLRVEIDEEFYFFIEKLCVRANTVQKQWDKLYGKYRDSVVYQCFIVNVILMSQHLMCV